MNENSEQPMVDFFTLLTERARGKHIFGEICGQTLTYPELMETVRKLCHFFSVSGFHSGDRIVIMSRHDLPVIEIFFAAFCAGLTPAILPADAKSERVRNIAGRLRPTAIFLDSELKGQWPWLERYRTVAIKPATLNRAVPWLGRFFTKKPPAGDTYPDLLQGCLTQDPVGQRSKSDIAYIFFTSGTTAAPKGILTSYGNVVSHLATFLRVFSYRPEHTIYNNLSLAHADGLFQGPLLAMYTGALLYRPEPVTVQNLETQFNAIFQKRVTHLITVPTVLALADRLLAHDDYFLGGDFQAIVSVAAKLDSNLWQRLENRFKVPICNIYGLTETVSGGLFCGPGDETRVIGTVGKPVDMEIRLVNDDGRDCPQGEVGELWMRGNNTTPGYLDDAPATEDLYSGSWLRSGDLARVREDCCVEIVGRKKAIIVSGGYTIVPDEVSEILRLYPGVHDTVTLGLPDREWGELAVSVVEAEDPIEETAMIDHCRKYLESYKVPKRILWLRELPRGVSGKIKLREIEALVTSCLAKQQGNTADTSAMLAEIVALAATVFNTAPENLAPHLAPADTPGWDSLGHLNLVAAVENRFSIEFSVEEMMRIDSLAKVVEMVAGKQIDPP